VRITATASENRQVSGLTTRRGKNKFALPPTTTGQQDAMTEQHGASALRNRRVEAQLVLQRVWPRRVYSCFGSILGFTFSFRGFDPVPDLSKLGDPGDAADDYDSYK
jgi:hypothetical protein